ncbi:retrovirus-related pol polyprotein from transposon TNT 1-94 [Tanacetum coccineum]|uniref:Retrovirus-related pol polyprotein from transposon TNT 1-94 n=1 Tax=Tanacetum coccineum TaxID=301880 RepID=A0ABQ5GCW2_9ASTR
MLCLQKNVVQIKKIVTNVDVKNALKAKDVLCVSCDKNVLIPCHDKCLVKHKLSVNSKARRALFTTPRTAKSKVLDAIPIVAKTRYGSFFSRLLDVQSYFHKVMVMAPKALAPKLWHLCNNSKLQETVPPTKRCSKDAIVPRGRLLRKQWLIFSKLLEFLWAKAISTACFTQNHSLIHTRYNKTLYELLRGRKPNVKYFHMFGSLCYPTNDREDLGKMKPKADIEPGMNRFQDTDSSAEDTSIPSKEDLDNLFGPLYAEYFEKRSPKVSINSVAQTTLNKTPHKRDENSSSSINIVEDNEALPKNLFCITKLLDPHGR